MKDQIDEELFLLSREFKSLNSDNKKSVLETAQGLLLVQRANEAVIADNAVSKKLKNEME